MGMTEVDQVIRRKEFERDHPHVEILPPGKDGRLVWVGTVPEVGQVHALDLRRLLDALEALISPDGCTQAKGPKSVRRQDGRLT